MNAKIVLFLFVFFSAGLLAVPKPASTKLVCDEELLHVEIRNSKQVCVDSMGFEPEEFALTLPKVSTAFAITNPQPSPAPNLHSPRPRWPYYVIAGGIVLLLAMLLVELLKRAKQEKSFVWGAVTVFAEKFDQRRNHEAGYPGLYQLEKFIAGRFRYSGMVVVKQNPEHNGPDFGEFQNIAAAEAAEIIRQLQWNSVECLVEPIGDSVFVRIHTRRERKWNRVS